MSDADGLLADQFGYVLTGLHDVGRVLGGSFALPTLSGDLTLSYTKEGQAGISLATIIPATPGDANLDGVVGYEDLAHLRNTIVLPGNAVWVDCDGAVDAWDIQRILAANSYDKGPGGYGWAQGDFSGDGLVNWADIQMILDHGQYDSGVGEALIAMVPEPATAAILAFGAAGLLRRRRR